MIEIPRVDRRTLRYEVSALEDGKPIDVTTVRFVVLPVGSHPDRRTTWVSAPVGEGVAQVIVAGPEAPSDTVAHFFLDVGDYLVRYQFNNGDDTITGDVERLSVE